jgi:flagellar biosynthetic protein FlhB
VADRDGRTEKPTGKRRQEARRRGQVARSTDVNSTVGLIAVVAVLAIGATTIMGRIEGMLAHSLSTVGDPSGVATTGVDKLVLGAMKSFATIVAPILLAALAAGVVANVAQVRLKWSSEALKPRFSNLNPKNGLKRIFGTNGLFETGKAILKLLVIGGVAFAAIWSQLGDLGSLVGVPAQEIVSQIGQRCLKMALEVIGALILLSGLDYMWQRRRIEKSLMMTREEVRQEARQTDVAPEVRGAIRRRQFQQARRRMLADVPTADVVVVNPTHFAVALRYDGNLPAPEVVAKGVDHIAAAIRAAAEEHGVPLVENPPLARTLYREVELGAMVPEALFVAVAEVLAYVYRTARGRARRRRPVLARA